MDNPEVIPVAQLGLHIGETTAGALCQKILVGLCRQVGGRGQVENAKMTLNYGLFINTIIGFVIVGFS